MQKTKQFQTQKISKWKLIDRLSWAIPALVFLYMLFGWGGPGAFFGEAIGLNNIPACIALAIFLILISGFFSLPLMLIWRAVTQYLRKRAIQNASYHAVEGIDYYREKLSDLSPTMISMLVDLEIEAKKDATALILKYAMMGVVSLDEGSIVVVNPEHPGLKQSDHIFLQELGQGTLSQGGLNRWQENAYFETLNEGRAKGFFIEDQTNTRSTSKGCAGGCLGAIVLFVAIMCVVVFVLDMDAIEAYLDAAPTNLISSYDQINYLIADPNMAFQLLIMLIVGMLLFVALALPIAGFIRSIVASARPATRITRTDEGYLLAEQIAGMKNYIRDFSNLSQAEKEALIVWDEFLIYAVVLEENEIITREILGMANFNYDRLRVV